MAEKTEAQTPAPRVGKGSPVGKRWFVTGCPNQTITILPHKPKEGNEREQKARRINFISQVKPASLQGEGKLGSHNHTGTDSNENPAWGVFVVEPKVKKEGKDLRVDQDQETIDFLREHEYYLTTHQDNTPTAGLMRKIKELDYDPRTLGAGVGRGVFARGHNQTEAPAPETEAPADKPASAGKARVATM